MKKIIHYFQLTLLSAVVVVLPACYTFMDMSEKGRQKMWLQSYRDRAIGKNIYECKARTVRTQPCAIFAGGDNPINSKQLANGHFEDEYSFGTRAGRCHYFYEYEPASGLIVGFRFEESRLFVCRISGV